MKVRLAGSHRCLLVLEEVRLRRGGSSGRRGPGSWTPDLPASAQPRLCYPEREAALLKACTVCLQERRRMQQTLGSGPVFSPVATVFL